MKEKEFNPLKEDIYLKNLLPKEKEFNLSEKRWFSDEDDWCYDEKDVKEFIKNLKEEIIGEVAYMLQGGAYDFIGKIDKLSGDKLI